MRLFTLGVIAVLASAAVYPHWPAHVPSLQSEVINATARIEFDPARGHGSGTAISPRRILTNHHVVVGAKGTIRVRGWIREGARILPVVYHATVIAQDAAKDLALLELDADWVGAIAPIADAMPAESSAVCKSGSALGKRPHVTCGVYAGIDDETIRGVRHAVHSAPTVMGDSGGGVWSAVSGRYELVAVTRAVPSFSNGFTATPITTMGLAVPLADVRSFLASADD
jgi:S1-C subfamily serine protease